MRSPHPNRLFATRPFLKPALALVTGVTLVTGVVALAGSNGPSTRVAATAPTVTGLGASAARAEAESRFRVAEAEAAAAVAARAQAEREALAKSAAERAARLRASRAASARPKPVPAPAPEAPPPTDFCTGWGYKTRAQSDACWHDEVAKHGGWNVGTMLRIMYCESKGNPWVVNSSNHVGLFQIKNSHTKGNGPANIAHAHAMWLKSGTRPWSQCGG